MLRISKSPEFTHKVTVLVPVDGGHDEQTFKARFKVMSTEESSRYDLQSSEGIQEFLNVAVVGLYDLVDVHDKPLVFNDELKASVLGLPYLRLALLRAYMDAVTKAKVGN
jgi:hypothetical protein